jgi:alpha-D-ribose 1-methylphosphonate 5-triphosphate synthase subunit PhnH
MSAVLAEMTPGFRDATHGAQQTFRTVLDAMSRPGRVLRLPATATRGVVPPASTQSDRPMGVGTAALLLTLLDADTSAHLAGTLGSGEAASYLRFHTGARLSAQAELAAFVVLRAAELDAPLWSRFDLGSDEAPQQGATLIVEVDALDARAATRLNLRGPGIETTQVLAVTGLSAAFWAWRAQTEALLPRGVEIVLVCGDRLAALPRTTRIEGET